MNEGWFTIEKIDESTYAISEYKHWEEVHSYLLIGDTNACLIDTGLGIGNIKEVTDELTDLPVKVINTHAHWDHIGGNDFYNNIYVHKKDSGWLKNGLPIPLKEIKKNLVKDLNRDNLPENFNLDDYSLYQGTPLELEDNDYLDLGNRLLKVIHTPGHSPGHICVYEEDKGYLYTGDLIYQGTLYAFYPSTNPQKFLKSTLKIKELPKINRILPGHFKLELTEKFLDDVKNGFLELKEKGLLFQGSGLHEFKNFQIKL